jgi:hypothetical protein
MKPNSSFLNLPESFWAHIRLISQELGYARKNAIIIPEIENISRALKNQNISHDHLLTNQNTLTELGQQVMGYFEYRAKILNKFVEPRLMDVKEAKSIYNKLYKQLSPKCPLPLNKQTGTKKSPAYLTGIVNMLIESNSRNLPCDYDPRKLVTVIRGDLPIRTFSRRFDGAFPSTINPVAVWEIKEYYYTTTFGSRVADGVYETLLDGMELENLRDKENIHIKHYLIVDSHFTWWECGRSYLCRIIDMLHMGYVDEVLFGREVIECLPDIVKSWSSKSK